MITLQAVAVSVIPTGVYEVYELVAEVVVMFWSVALSVAEPDSAMSLVLL